MIVKPLIETKILPDGSKVEFQKYKGGATSVLRVLEKGNKKVNYPKNRTVRMALDGSALYVIKENNTTEYLGVRFLGSERESFLKSLREKKKKKSVKQKKEAPNMLDKFLQTTSPVSLMRLSPFMPIDKVSKNSKIYKDFLKNKGKVHRETVYGEVGTEKVKITTEVDSVILTMQHKALLDIIAASSDKDNTEIYKVLNSQNVEVGKEILITISLYEISKKLGIEWGSKTKDNIIKMLSEIAGTVITIKIKSGKTTHGVMFQIISNLKWKDSDDHRHDKIQIHFSSEYSAYLQKNMALNYTNRINEITSIKGEGSGLIKAIIYFFITHQAADNKKNQISFAKLMNAVGYPIVENQDENKKRNRMKERALSYVSRYGKELANFNIVYNKKTKCFEYGGTNDNDIVFVK